MGIQGFGQYQDFMSNYRINDIPRVIEAPEVKTSEVTGISQNINTVPSNVDIEGNAAANRPRFLDPNEVSIGFQKNNDFSYLGKDKDVESLDMQKAISDMKQDSVLQEYQYFVGSAQNIYQSSDGTVLQKY